MVSSHKYAWSFNMALCNPFIIPPPKWNNMGIFTPCLKVKEITFNGILQ